MPILDSQCSYGKPGQMLDLMLVTSSRVVNLPLVSGCITIFNLTDHLGQPPYLWLLFSLFLVLVLAGLFFATEAELCADYASCER